MAGSTVATAAPAPVLPALQPANMVIVMAEAAMNAAPLIRLLMDILSVLLANGWQRWREPWGRRRRKATDPAAAVRGPADSTEWAIYPGLCERISRQTGQLHAPVWLLRRGGWPRREVAPPVLGGHPG